MELSPAEYIIHVFGGIRPAGRAIGRDGSAISQWKKKGRIPSKAQQEILEIAKRYALDITPDDLISGRVVSREPIKTKP